jgi:hypothetical protein
MLLMPYKQQGDDMWTDRNHCLSAMCKHCVVTFPVQWGVVIMEVCQLCTDVYIPPLQDMLKMFPVNLDTVFKPSKQILALAFCSCSLCISDSEVFGLFWMCLRYVNRFSSDLATFSSVTLLKTYMNCSVFCSYRILLEMSISVSGNCQKIGCSICLT